MRNAQPKMTQNQSVSAGSLCLLLGSTSARRLCARDRLSALRTTFMWIGDQQLSIGPGPRLLAIELSPSLVSLRLERRFGTRRDDYRPSRASLRIPRGFGPLLRLENPQRLLIMAHRLFRLLLRGEHPRQPRMSFG